MLVAVRLQADDRSRGDLVGAAMERMSSTGLPCRDRLSALETSLELTGFRGVRAKELLHGCRLVTGSATTNARTAALCKAVVFVGNGRASVGMYRSRGNSTQWRSCDAAQTLGSG